MGEGGEAEDGGREGRPRGVFGCLDLRESERERDRDRERARESKREKERESLLRRRCSLKGLAYAYIGVPSVILS